MHFAICNEIFKDRSWDRTRRYAREVGYQALEIAPLTFAPRVADLDAARRRETRDTAEAAGIAMFGLRGELADTEGLHVNQVVTATVMWTAKGAR